MIIKILGFFDLLTALIIFLLHNNLVGWKIALIAFIYLMIKAVVFFGDIMSILDGVTGIYIIVLLLGFHTFLTYIFIIYLVQKAVFSFL